MSAITGRCMDCGAERPADELMMVERLTPYRHSVLVCVNFVACWWRRRKGGPR